jgi:hypothetical protein
LVDISTDTPQAQTGLRERTILFLLLGLGGLFILVGSVWLVANWLVIGQGNVTTPTSLADLPLSRQITGPAALADIERLHGKDFPMTDGAIAFYDNEQAILWISTTWLPFMAARQVEAMTERIVEGHSPFTPVEKRQVEGITVYVLTGMGHVHYYFQLDRRVVWLAVSPQLAEQSLEEIIRKLA